MKPTNILIGLTLLIAPTLGRGAEPATKQQVPLVIAFQGGKAIAAQALPITDSFDTCQAELKAFVSEYKPNAGVTLQIGCIEVPPLTPIST